MSIKKRVVVAGDVTIDWFMYPVVPDDEGENWRLHAAAHADALPGGAMLLADLVRHSIAASGVEAEVSGPTLGKPIRVVPPDEVVHSNAMLGFFPAHERKGRVLRVDRALGYIGPRKGRPRALKPSPDVRRADVVVLDDAGNAFRHEPGAWPKALDRSGDPVVVYKMCRPLGGGALWRKAGSRHGENLVVVVNARDLRATPGVYISRSLSWERTAKELLYQLQRSQELEVLRSCSHLVVLFGTEGAVIYRKDEAPHAHLLFDPLHLEDGFDARIAGTMHGITAVLTATIAAEVAASGLQALERAVPLGLARARALLAAGLEEVEGALRYPLGRVFGENVGGSGYASCPVTLSTDSKDPDPQPQWRIFDEKTRNTRHVVAKEIVVHGESGGLGGVPVGEFGKLRTIDRAEVESYGAIRELLVEFLANPRPPRPLCFAVFGPPGSGKSFGVKQVMKSINAADVESVTFNISQFADYSDLVAAFHRVRDIALSGKVPFVFFDEFDSARPNQPLGWLKLFLAPMQDGEFKDGEAIHPIGKAVFVFAGGTRSTFGSFVRNLSDSDAGLSDPSNEASAEDRERAARKAFGEAKGPDFVSRLRGFIDIMGPNRQGTDDEAFVIRRAMVLRAMLLETPKTAGLLDSRNRLRIDDGVLRAMLHVSEYRHGTRSLGALLDMSRIAGASRYDLSALPPRSQLDLHVDAEEFMFLTKQERFQSLVSLRDRRWLVDEHRGDLISVKSEEDLGQPVEHRRHEDVFIHVIARKVREHRDRLRQRQQADPVEPFDDLPGEPDWSSEQFASDIPRKLRAVNHGLRRCSEDATPWSPGRTKDRRPRTPDLSDQDVEDLARMDHERFCRQLRQKGYVFEKVLDHERKTTPYLVSYDKLPAPVRVHFRQMIQGIPVVLSEIGFEVYRMEEVGVLDDPVFIERLARAMHEDYVSKRLAGGDTPESNPSLVPFDDLPDDLKNANWDSAASIPRKLARVGYTVHRVRRGAEPRHLELTAEEIEEMSVLEHARWNWHMLLQGWVYGPKPKDKDRKTTPHLVPWSELEDSIREYDRENIRLIPELLAGIGHEATRG